MKYYSSISIPCKNNCLGWHNSTFYMVDAQETVVLGFIKMHKEVPVV